MKRAILFVAALFILVSVACTPAEEEGLYCENILDCPEGYDCVDNQCIVGTGQSDTGGGSDTATDTGTDAAIDTNADNPTDTGADNAVDDVTDDGETTDDTAPVDVDTAPAVECGDGTVEGDEVCETGDTKACNEIAEGNFDNTTAVPCASDCGGWTTTDCTCADGYTKESETCADINECDTLNGGCAQNCVNNPGSFACSCDIYYELNADGKSCDLCALDTACGAGCNPCSGDEAHCRDVGNGTTECVQCTEEAHCAAITATPHCLTADHVCVQCRDDNDCNAANEEECSVDNVCVVPPPIPAAACVAGSQNRDGCGSARVISRTEAAVGWTTSNQNTCSANDRHSETCGGLFAVGNDHTYVVYVAAGETLRVTLTERSTKCNSGDASWESRLKFKKNTASGGATSCPSTINCWATPSVERTHTPTEDEWIYIIVDGGATAYDEHRGYYDLSVTLSNCADGACACI